MSSRFASTIASFALATALGVFALSAASPACAAEQSVKEDAAEAKALKTAEVKLAALVREGTEESVPQEAVKQKPKTIVKKKSRPIRKKVAVKVRRAAQAKGPVSNGKVLNVVSRRLTQSEVSGILSTTRDFSGSDLSGMNLVGMDLSGSKLNRANLQMANLERADLTESDLELADLSGANLRGASLNQARLRGTRLEDTRMDGALWIDRTICRKGSVGACIE